eukprot:Em0098g1a
MELYYNGSYGTICQIGWDWWMPLLCARALEMQQHWFAMGGAAYGPGTGHSHSSDQCAEDAQVICCQLGFSGTSVAFSNAYFGAGSSNQPICSTRTPVHVMMWCLIFVLTGRQLVRLASGPTPTEGRVELYCNGSPYDQKG